MILVLLTACYREKITDQLLRKIVNRLPECVCVSLKIQGPDDIEPYNVDVYIQDLRNRNDILSNNDLVIEILQDPLDSHKGEFNQGVFEAEIEKIIPKGINCSLIWKLYDGWTHTKQFESGK